MGQSINDSIELEKLKIEDKRKILRVFPNAVIQTIENAAQAFVASDVINHQKAKLEINFAHMRFVARLVVDFGTSKADPTKHIKVYSDSLTILSNLQICDLINSYKETSEYIVKLIKHSKS
jgi:hypothetical protein